MIYRTYGCNHCNIEFTTTDDDPACPKCQGQELHWVPVAGHGGIISGSTRAQDGYFKTQAARHGLTNLHSARTGEAMAPREVSAPRQTQPIQVAPGISVPMALNSQNQPVMSIQNFTPTKGMMPSFGEGLPVRNTAPLSSMTEIAGRYDGRK